MARNNFWPDLAFIAGVIALYLNLPVNLAKYYAVPGLLAAAIPAVLLIPLAWRLVVRRDRVVLDRVFGLMLGFLAVLTGSALFARDASVALEGIGTFVVEGLVLYFIITNCLRSIAALRRVLWGIMVSAALVGAVNFYQEMTKDYEDAYGGLAQRVMNDKNGKVRLSERTQGQVGEQNRFAQIMLVFLPFGVIAFTRRDAGRMRVFAGVTTALVAYGILLSYSRGAFLAIGAMAFMAIVLGFIDYRRLLLPAAVAAAAVVILAPEYIERIGTLVSAQGLVDDRSETEAEPVLESRATEMLSAFYVAADHPVLGVGPGQYLPFYSLDYQMSPDIAYTFIPMPRRAHNLYLEMAAETGVIGLAAFMAIVTATMAGLYRTGRAWAHEHPEHADIAFALWLGIVGYLVSGMFLHFSYQRYFWLLIGLAGATVQIFRTEAEKTCSES